MLRRIGCVRHRSGREVAAARADDKDARRTVDETDFAINRPFRRHVVDYGRTCRVIETHVRPPSVVTTAGAVL